MNRDFSLIDANINRAKEGLRVVEDVCRFILRSRLLFERTKILRHDLEEVEKVLGTASKLSGRAGEDVGTAPVVQSEYIRNSLWGVLKANFGRAIEAVRVLEEFSKIYFPGRAQKIEEIRYKIYKLEFDTLSVSPHYWLNLYFEAGTVYPLSDDVNELVWLIDKGAKIVQLRDKSNSKKTVYEKARQVCDYIKEREVKQKNEGKILFILNDHPDIASVLPVSGVHLGQEDMPIFKARRILGSRKIIGRSNHSLEQLRQSISSGADYVSVGPVYATPTKAGRPAVGLELVKQAAEEVIIPWLAIGGIDKDNVNDLYEAGAKNVAVVRAARTFFI